VRRRTTVRNDAEMLDLARYAGEGNVRLFRGPHHKLVYAQW